MANVQLYIKGMPNPPEPATRKRIRNPEAHRAAILTAAREVFGERGYALGTIREIARRAGVTHGLVVRHFETKEQLFVSCLLDGRRIPADVTVDMSDLPVRIARDYVERIEEDGSQDPFIALIRSAADIDVAKQLLRAMRMQPADAYLAGFDAADREQRGDLLGALLIGVTFSRYVLADGPLAAMTADEVIAFLTPLIRAILLPE